MKTASFIVLIAGAVLAGAFVQSQWGWLGGTGNADKEAGDAILYWVAPMNPDYRRDKPGKSPMGMDLIPVYAGQGQQQGSGDTVAIAPAVQQNLGLRTARVTAGPLWRKVSALATVEPDESLITHVHLRTSGWIERLYVDSQGDAVQSGQLLMELYSPDVVNAQNEYLQASRRSDPSLLRAARDKLAALGVAEREIEALIERGAASSTIRIWAPNAGVVTALNVREGMHVQPSTVLLSLADLSSVWLDTEVFESQAAWMQEGLRAQAQLGYLPGQSFEGTVDYVYPILDAQSRTLRARLRFDNPEMLLKPNMYADVTIYGGAMRDVLSIPSESLIRSGTMDRVVVREGDGQFSVREVRVGTRSGGWTQVLEGLAEGDVVVTSAQFLIDSEASIAGAVRRLEAEPDRDAGSESHSIDSMEGHNHD